MKPLFLSEVYRLLLSIGIHDSELTVEVVKAGFESKKIIFKKGPAVLNNR